MNNPGHQIPIAVIYLRSVSPKQADRDMAIVAQQHACQRRANELGARVVGECVDLGSGFHADRLGVTQLVAKIKEAWAANRATVLYVIAYDHSCIGQNMQTYSRVAWKIEETGATLMIASRPLVEYEAVAGRPSEVYPDFPARTFFANPLRPPWPHPPADEHDIKADQ
jgi:DNA invertase Pin-like site-specific DNA recombinase